MLRKLLSYTLFLFGLISLQASCQKSEPKPLILNDPDFLSYWFFPAGSYWIYEDSLNGSLDTFLIETANVWEINNRYGDNRLQHHGLSVKYRDRISYQVAKPFAFSTKDVGLYTLDESSVNYFTFRFYYDKNGSNWFSGNTIMLYSNYLDSIEMKSKKYFNVIRIDAESQITTDSLVKEYYAKNIGVIKQVFKSGRVIELKEYYIAP
jgi:hypothetical protein